MALTGPFEPGGAGRLSAWRSLDLWSVGTIVITLLVAAPIIAVIVLATSSTGEIWAHLASTVLGHYAFNTFFLALGTGLGAGIIGVATAWLVTMCRFPGQGIFEWLLLVPLAMPAYVVAYVFTDLLDYTGPVQMFLRDVFGWASARDGRSKAGSRALPDARGSFECPGEVVT
jgi:iron(III) transport system permease protein